MICSEPNSSLSVLYNVLVNQNYLLIIIIKSFIKKSIVSIVLKIHSDTKFNKL